MDALARIDRAACSALWRMPAALSAAVICLGSIGAMVGLAAAMVYGISMVLGR